MYNEYNGLGQRIATEENGVRYGFTIDRGSIITEVDSNNELISRSIRGYELIANKDNRDVLSYYLHNAHGDVTNLVDGNGQVLNSYQYDAFGKTLSKAEEVANRFMYAGEQFDEVSGHYYLRARYYAPNIGRFTQEDTYRGDGLNLYRYVRNNPVKYIDPTGHWPQWLDNAVDKVKETASNVVNGVVNAANKVKETVVNVANEVVDKLSRVDWEKMAYGAAQVVGGIGELALAAGASSTIGGIVFGATAAVHGASNIGEGLSKMFNSVFEEDKVKEVNLVRDGIYRPVVGTISKGLGADEELATAIADSTYGLVDFGISAYGTVQGIREVARAISTSSNPVQLVEDGYGMLRQISSRTQPKVTINPKTITYNPYFGTYFAKAKLTLKPLKVGGLISDPVNYKSSIETVWDNVRNQLGEKCGAY